MKRTTLLLTVLTAAMVMALVMVAMALPVFAGGDDEDNASGDSTRNGQIVFRRWFDPDQTKSALFVMNPDTRHTRTVVQCGARCLAATDPEFSPDGDSIVYSRGVGPFVPKGQPRKTPEWKQLYSAIFIV